MQKKTIQVKNLINEIRLDHFLVKELNISRSQVNKLMKENSFFVNDVLVEKSGHVVKNNDQIIMTSQEDKAEEIIVQDLSSYKNYILFEDDDLIIFNKPKNLLVHPTSFNEQNTVSDFIKIYIKNNDFIDNDRCGIVHRLDRNTNGLMLIAKNEQTLSKLKDAISKKEIVRKYYAIAHNHFNENLFLIKVPLIRSSNNSTKMIPSDKADAKLAITEVKLISNLKNGLSYVECNLLTGRTHQIRAHMKYISHPILNDEIYGQYDNYKNYGQFLYSHFISFIHPRYNKYMEFSIQPDEVFEKVLKEHLDNE